MDPILIEVERLTVNTQITEEQNLATTPNRNNEQVTTPIQSAFSENFIIISASVAGVIIIVFGPVLVEQVTRTKTTQII
jgi:hypothetical protein